MPKKVEFIESYIKVDGSDYQWRDNHGELVRCRDCEFYTAEEKWCRRLGLCGVFGEDDYCSHAERKEVEDE